MRMQYSLSARTSDNASVAALLRRIPDGRRERPLLRRHRHLRVRDLDLEVRRVVRGPARRRDFEDARVVDRADRRIEVRVLPDGDEFWIADGVGPRCDGDVDGVPHRGELAIDDPATVLVAPDLVVDLLLRLAVLAQPSLDDLDAIEVATEPVFESGDEERRR